MFSRILLFHLLFILHSLPLVFAELGGAPSDVLTLQGMDSYKYQRWLRKGLIVQFEIGGHITFHYLGRPGGQDIYLTEKNKDRLVGTWGPMPSSSIPLERRLDELTFSLGKGGIITHNVRTPQGLPTLSESPALLTAQETVPLGLGGLEGDWYRVLKGHGGDKNDVIRIGQNSQGIGSLAINGLEWTSNSIPRGHLLGGWRSYPKPGVNDQLLLFSVVRGELNYKLTLPGGPYTGPWIPISTSKHVPPAPPRPQSPQRYGSPPPHPPPRPNTPPQNQDWKAKLSSRLPKWPPMFRQQSR